MEINSYFKGIATVLFSVITITGIIIWFFKEIVKKFMQADNERHKNRLKLEHQKYTRLQEEQFETIKTIYSNLIKTDELLTEYFGVVKDEMEFDEKTKNNTLKPLIETIFETQRYFRKNNIFLNDSLSENIEKCIESLFFCMKQSSHAHIIISEEIFNEKGEYLGIQPRKLIDLKEQEKIEFEKTIDIIEKIRNNELKDSIKSLKIEFRELFGVE